MPNSGRTPSPATVLNAIASAFVVGEDWVPLSVRYRLAASVVQSLLDAGYEIVPVTAPARGSS